jgi:amidohydrolase
MGGAEKMIQAGVLDAPRPDVALALHVWNEMPVGHFGIAAGSVMAGAEIFKITVHGKGGHGAIPHLTVDPIVAAAHIVTALQGIVARNVPPFQTAVVSVCTLHGGETFNVIPPAVEMTGTIRTFDTTIRQMVIDRFNKLVTDTAQAMGCRAEIDLQQLTPALNNDPGVVTRIQAVARDLFPDAVINTTSNFTMGSEDFAFILDKIPGGFIFMGAANSEKGLDSPHHHPLFDIDETVLPYATTLLTGVVLDLLSK